MDNIISASQRHQAQVVEQYLASSPVTGDHFEVGDFVCVSYPEKPPHKLAPRWRGPMTVISRNGNIYECMDLITQAVMTVDFDRLKRYIVRDIPPAEVALRDSDAFVVESVIDHIGSHKRKSELFFRVRWLGYGSEEDTWLVHRKVKYLAALDTYLQSHPELHL